MRIHREGGLTFAQIERKTPVLRPTLQSKQSSPCGLHRSGDRGGGEPNGQIVSAKRTADRRRQRSRKIITEEKGKYTAKNGSTKEHLERNDSCDFEKSHKRTRQKEMTESNEQSKEGGQPK